MFTSVILLNIVYFSVCLTSNKLYYIPLQNFIRTNSDSNQSKLIGLKPLAKMNVFMSLLSWGLIKYPVRFAFLSQVFGCRLSEKIFRNDRTFVPGTK